MKIKESPKKALGSLAKLAPSVFARKVGSFLLTFPCLLNSLDFTPLRSLYLKQRLSIGALGTSEMLQSFPFFSVLLLLFFFEGGYLVG